MLWYAMACAVMAALLCLALGASDMPLPAIVVIDLAALAWLAAVGCCVLGGWAA